MRASKLSKTWLDDIPDIFFNYFNVIKGVTPEKRMGGNTLFGGRNQLFCNKKQILTCTSHELQLFDTSVMIKGRADD